MANVLRTGAAGAVGGAGAGAAQYPRGPYSPLEAQYPAYAKRIIDLRGAGVPDEEIEARIKRDITRMLGDEPSDIKKQRVAEAIKQPDETLDWTTRAKEFARTLLEGVRAQPGARNTLISQGGMVEGATLGYHRPSGAPVPTTREEYAVNELGKFIGGLGLGMPLGAGLSLARGALVGAPQALLGRMGLATAENMAANIAMAGAAKTPSGGLDLGERATAMKEAVTDPLSLMFVGGGSVLGGALMKPGPSGRSVRGTAAAGAPEVPLPTEPPTPVPGPTVTVSEAQPTPVMPPVGRPTGAPTPLASEPTPVRLDADRVKYEAQKARTVSEEKRAEVAARKAEYLRLESEVRAADLEHADLLRQPEVDEKAVDMNRRRVSELKKQQGVEEQRVLNAQKTQAYIEQARTEAQPTPQRTRKLQLGSMIEVDTTPAGRVERPPDIGTDTVINMIKADVHATGKMSPETEVVAAEHAKRSRSFREYEFAKTLFDAEEVWKESQQPAPLPKRPTTTGKYVADWVEGKIKGQFQDPILDNFTNDEILAGARFLREQVSGPTVRYYPDRVPSELGTAPGKFMKFIYDPQEGRPRKGPRMDPEGRPMPESRLTALQKLEDEVTKRDIAEHGRVRPQLEDITRASQLVYKGFNPATGHRVELFRELPGGYLSSQGHVSVPDDVWKANAADWEGKVSYGGRRPGNLVDMEDALKQSVANLVRKADVRRRGGEKTSPSLAGFMEATGFERSLAERWWRRLLPDEPIAVIRDPARVARMDAMIERAGRRGYPVVDLKNERVNLDGYSRETYERFFPQETVAPKDVEARKPLATISGTERFNEALKKLDTDIKDALKEGDANTHEYLAAKREALTPGDDTHKIVAYDPEGDIAAVIGLKGNAQEARQQFDKVKAAHPGTTMELLPVKTEAEAKMVQPARPGEVVPTREGLRKGAEKVGPITTERRPLTHEVTVYDSAGNPRATESFTSLAEAEAFKKSLEGMNKFYEGANITGRIREYAPEKREPAYRPPRGAPEEAPVGTYVPGEGFVESEQVRVPGAGRRTKGGKIKEAVRLPEHEPILTRSMKRNEVRSLAEEKGYQMVEWEIPGQPYKVGVVGPDGPIWYDSVENLGRALQLMDDKGAKASTQRAARRGEKLDPEDGAQFRRDQNTVQPNSTRNPQVDPLPTEGLPPEIPGGGDPGALGAFLGIPFIPGFKFKSPQFYERLSQVPWVGMLQYLRQKGLTEGQISESMRHIARVETDVSPGIVAKVLDTVQVPTLYDNVVDRLGAPQNSTNPVIQAISKHALLAHDQPKIQEYKAQVATIKRDNDHLNPAQRAQAYDDVWGGVPARDPTARAAADAFRSWALDIADRQGLDRDWHMYLRGVVDKQETFTQLKSIIADFRNWNDVPDLYKAWVSGPKEWDTFYKSVMGNQYWPAVPRNARDIINRNWLTWEGSGATWELMPDELKALWPKGVHHMFALNGGRPPVKDLATFQRAVVPMVIDNLYTRPFEELWKPVIDMYPEGHPMRDWARKYFQMVAGGAERSDITRSADNVIRGWEDGIGKSLAQDHLIDNLANTWNRNQYRGLLGLAPDSATRQSLALVQTWLDYGAWRIGHAITRAIYDSDFRKLAIDTAGRTGIMTDVAWDFHYGQTGVPRDGTAFQDWMARRLGITREHYNAVDHTLTTLAMAPMRFVDNVTKGITMLAALDEALVQGLPVKQAMEHAFLRLDTTRPNYSLTNLQSQAMWRVSQNQFGHMPSQQSTAWRNPLARSMSLFWNTPVKILQQASNSFYNLLRDGDGIDPYAARSVRTLAYLGLLAGGVQAGKWMGLDLSRVYGAGIFPAMIGNALQPLTAWYNITLGDNPIPDDKWQRWWIDALSGIGGVPLRGPFKVAGGVEAAREGAMRDAYGDQLYDTNGWTELLRMLAVEGPNFKAREYLRNVSKEQMEVKIARRNAIGRFVMSKGEDTSAVEAFNNEYGERSGMPITMDTLNNALNRSQVPKVERMQQTPIGQHVLEEMGALP